MISVRRPSFDYPADLARYWHGNSPAKTHVLNGFHLFLPPAEKYMIAIMKRSRPLLEGSALEEQARGFIGQEAQHAAQHERFLMSLRAQEYRIDGFMGRLSCVFAFLLRRARLSLCLAVAAAAEHLTAVAAEHALRHRMFQEVQSPVKQLFEWHAAEELEHKSVVYDAMLMHRAGYLTRMVGLCIGGSIFLVTILVGALFLLHQDRQLWTRRTFIELRTYLWDFGLFGALGSGLLSYARLGFHPGRHLTDSLVSETLEELGLQESFVPYQPRTDRMLS